MRMRRKKNLEEKLNDVSDVLIMPRSEEKDTRAANEQKEYLDFPAFFKNNSPVYLEIGCGKGGFALQYALIHPEINYIALEKSANVIYGGCAEAKANGIKNLLFVNTDAKLLPKYFAPSSVERIYLNFSCPYPKKTYENRRLTNPRFLEYYREILNPKGLIYQKTDNIDFFEYSLSSFKENGWSIEFETRDLNVFDTANIMTEYERRFSGIGCKICALIAKKL